MFLFTLIQAAKLATITLILDVIIKLEERITLNQNGKIF